MKRSVRRMAGGAWILVAMLGAGGACKKGAGSPPPQAAAPPANEAPAAPSASCPEVGAVIERLTLASVQGGSKVEPQLQEAMGRMAASLRQASETRCAADAWSETARHCIATAETMQALERCEPELTKQQQEKLSAEMKAAVDAELVRSTPAQPVPSADTPIYQETGLAACNDYLRAVERLVACDKIPQAAKDAQRQAVAAMKDGWRSLNEPNVPAEARKAAEDGCRVAVDALREALAASGCPP